MSDRDRIKNALTDAHGLCAQLGFLDGPYGRTWARQARGVLVRCPWHGDRTPSCSVRLADDGTIAVYCHGCKTGGDAFALIAFVEGLDTRTEFRRVLDRAADLAGVARPDATRHDTPIVTPRPRPVKAEEPEDDLMAAVSDVLAQRSRAIDYAPARDYLRARGLATSEACGWYYLPGDARAREALREALVAEIGPDLWRATGLASEDGARWSGAWRGPRLIIPWRDLNGAVRTLQGRYLGDCPDGVAKYTFPRERSPRWPFGCERLADAEDDAPVAIVEGALDAVSFGELARGADEGDVVPLAIPGTSGWRASWLRLCRKRPCVVALDADESGQERARVLATELCMVAKRGPRGPLVSVRSPRGGKDWNDVLKGAMAA